MEAPPTPLYFEILPLDAKRILGGYLLTSELSEFHYNGDLPEDIPTAKRFIDMIEEDELDEMAANSRYHRGDMRTSEKTIRRLDIQIKKRRLNEELKIVKERVHEVLKDTFRVWK